MTKSEHSEIHPACRVKLLAAVIAGVMLASLASAISPGANRSLQQMRVADGFEVTLVASEPDIRQPISVTFDERGRMWVIQYLQYPKPAGLKPTKVDQYLRTRYDQTPAPPPRGPKGADRITICEDTDGDGRMDKFKDFVADLNLCSGMALGYDGVFVAQPPYLLFYPDRNHDDVPDGDPEVLLSGFGIEDAHALANSLTWGPDDWLYGAQGSTVTANIRGIEFQQGIWRYHPVTHEFELFAEGGGNTWGVDFDEHGELIAGTNWEDKMLHQVQGGYYLKNFGKHGELHNPHAYGFFGHVPYTGYRGAHLSVGGIVYQGGAFPAAFRNTYISANTLDHAIYWHNLVPSKSSFTASFGGALLKTDEEIFRPVDCQPGPDGALYIADWCDKRATHVDPLDTWDRSNGRIYRVQARNAAAPKPFDLGKLTSDQLVDLLADPNDWFAREARRLLAERRDKTTYARLQKQIAGNDRHVALQSLWALYASGGFSNKIAGKLLRHPDEHVRAWTVRLLGDARKIAPGLQDVLAELSGEDPSPVVRRQLASSIRRFTDGDWPIIQGLLLHNEDAADPFIPLLLWWALETKIGENENIAEVFTPSTTYPRALVREHLLERLGRRYAAEASDAGFKMCARLLEAAPTPTDAEILLNGINQGLVGRRVEKFPVALNEWMQRIWTRTTPSRALWQVSLRLGLPQARSNVFNVINSQWGTQADRVALIEIVGQRAEPESVGPLLDLLKPTKAAGLAGPALVALQHFSDAKIATALLDLYPRASADLRRQVIVTLGTRPAWAQALVGAVEDGRLAKNDITPDQARQLMALKDAALGKRVERLWGKIRADSPEEKRSFINEVKLILKPSGVAGRDARGHPADGKQVFTQTCGICHRLFGEGNNIGPDLTSAERRNIDVLLGNIVNPSAYIRPEFVNFDAATKDGQSIAGLMVESTASAVTLVDRNNQRHVLAREQIAALRESELSLMPEGMLESLTPKQLMDLFSYLQSDGPEASAPK